jgi:hypothetical protein
MGTKRSAFDLFCRYTLDKILSARNLYEQIAKERSSRLATLFMLCSHSHLLMKRLPESGAKDQPSFHSLCAQKTELEE